MTTTKRKNIKDEKWYWDYMKEHFGISKEGGAKESLLHEENSNDECEEADLYDLDEKTREEIREAIESNYESEPLNL